ncbi:MAG: hypothetical protein E5Y52_10145, partial [Mesorhizobium sp.]
MQIGMMGLGRMGANMVRRLMRDGHECVVYDINSASVAGMVKDGAIGAASLEAGADPGSKPPKDGGTAPYGYLHCGPSGAGHFVKMVHNGIEYGVMAAYAEGINILKSANAGKRARTADAETSPLESPQYYQFDIDLPAVA